LHPLVKCTFTAHRKFNPAALFAPLADGDGFALINGCRALRRDDVAPALDRL
jgi:hypothetical protein